MITNVTKRFKSGPAVSGARIFALSALVFTLMAGWPQASRADDAEDAAMQPVWLNYWEAISASRLCESRTFTDVDYDAMVHVINGKVDNAIGAGARHHLIDQAKDTVQDRVSKFGCYDSQVTDLLRLFHHDLQPALQD